MPVGRTQRLSSRNSKTWHMTSPCRWGTCFRTTTQRRCRNRGYHWKMKRRRTRKSKRRETESTKMRWKKLKKWMKKVWKRLQLKRTVTAATPPA